MKRHIAILLVFVVFLSYTVVYNAESSESEGSRVVIVTAKDNNGNFANNDNANMNKYEVNLLETTEYENAICVEYNKSTLDTVDDIADKLVITVPNSSVKEDKIKSNYPEVINKISKSASLNELYATDITIELLPYMMLNVNNYKFEIPFILNDTTNLSNISVLLQKGNASKTFAWNIRTIPYENNTSAPDIEPSPEPELGIFDRFNKGTHFTCTSKEIASGINYKIQLNIVSLENENDITLSLRHPSIYFKDKLGNYVLGVYNITLDSLAKDISQALDLEVKAGANFKYDEPLTVFVNNIKLDTTINFLSADLPTIMNISPSADFIVNKENVLSFKLNNYNSFEVDQSFVVDFKGDSNSVNFLENSKILNINKGLSSGAFTLPFTPLQEFMNGIISCSVKSSVDNKDILIAEKSLQINSLSDNSSKTIDYYFNDLEKNIEISDNTSSEIALDITNNSNIAQAITVKIQPTNQLLSFKSNSSTSIEKINPSLYAFTQYIDANSSSKVTMLAVMDKLEDTILKENITTKFTITNSDDDNTNNICTFNFVINKQEEATEPSTEDSPEQSHIDYLFKDSLKKISVNSNDTSDVSLNIINNSDIAQDITVKIQTTDPLISFISSNDLTVNKINSSLYVFTKHISANSSVDVKVFSQIGELDKNISSKTIPIKFIIANSDDNLENNTCIVDFNITRGEAPSEPPSTETSPKDYLFEEATKSISLKSGDSSEFSLNILNNSNTDQTLEVTIEVPSSFISFKSKGDISIEKISSSSYTFSKYIYASSSATIPLLIEANILEQGISEKTVNAIFTLNNTDDNENNNTFVLTCHINKAEILEPSTEETTPEPTEPSTEETTPKPTEPSTEENQEYNVNLNDYFTANIIATPFKLNSSSIISLNVNILKPLDVTVYNPKIIVEIEGIVEESNTGHYLETIYIPSLSVTNIEKVKVSVTPKVVGNYTISIKLEADNLMSSGNICSTKIFEVTNDTISPNLIDINLNDYFDINISDSDLVLNKKCHIKLESFMIKPLIYEIENPRIVFTIIGDCKETNNNRYSVTKNLSSLDTNSINNIDISFTPKSYGDFFISCTLLVDNLLPNGSLYQTKTLSLLNDKDSENNLNLNDYFKLNLVSSPIDINSQTVVRIDAEQLQNLPYPILNSKVIFEIVGEVAESHTTTYTKTINLPSLSTTSISNSIITFTPISYGDYVVSAFIITDNLKPLGNINVSKVLTVPKPVENINLKEYFNLDINASLHFNQQSAIQLSATELKPFTKQAINPKVIFEINASAVDSQKYFYIETIELETLTVNSLNNTIIQYLPKCYGIYNISVLLTADNLLPFCDIKIMKTFEIDKNDASNTNLDLNDYFKFDIVTSNLSVNKQSVIKLEVTTLKELYDVVKNPKLIFEITGDTLDAINKYQSKSVSLEELSENELEKASMFFTPLSRGNYIVSVSLLIDNVSPLGSIKKTTTLTIDVDEQVDKLDLNDYFNFNISTSSAISNKQVLIGLDAQKLLPLKNTPENPRIVFKIIGDVIGNKDGEYVQIVTLNSLTINDIENASISFIPKSKGTYVISVLLTADNLIPDGTIEKIKVIDVLSSNDDIIEKPIYVNLNDFFSINMIHSSLNLNEATLISLDTKQINILDSEIQNPQVIFTVLGDCKEAINKKYTITRSLSDLTEDTLNNLHISFTPMSYSSYKISVAILVDNALPSGNIYISDVLTLVEEETNNKPELPTKDIDLNDYFHITLNTKTTSVNEKVTISLDVSELQLPDVVFINPQIIYEVTGNTLESPTNCYTITKPLNSLSRETLEQELFNFTPKYEGYYLLTFTLICDNIISKGKIYEVKTINIDNSEEPPPDSKPNYREIDLNDYFSLSLYTSPLDINTISVIGINVDQHKILDSDIKNPRIVFEVQGDINESKDKYYSITKPLFTLSKSTIENTNITFTPNSIGSYIVSVSILADNIVDKGNIFVKSIFKLGNVPDDNKPTPNPSPDFINLNEYFSFKFNPENIELHRKSVVSLSASQIKTLDTTIINPRIIFEVTGALKESNISTYTVEKKLTTLSPINIESVNIAFTPESKGIYTVTATLLADNISSDGSIFKKFSYDLTDEGNKDGTIPDRPIIAYGLLKVDSEVIQLDKNMATLKVTVSNKSDYLIRNSELSLSFSPNIRVKEPNRNLSFNYLLGNLNKVSTKVLEFPIEILKPCKPEIMIKLLSKDINTALYTPSDYYNSYLSFEDLSSNSINTYTISGIIFHDKNNNSLYDTNETGLSSIPIKLTDTTNTLISSTISDSVGFYSFSDLKPGLYTVNTLINNKQINRQIILGSSNVSDYNIGFFYKDSNNENQSSNSNPAFNSTNLSKDISISLSITNQSKETALATLTIKNNSTKPAPNVYLLINPKNLGIVAPNDWLYSNNSYRTSTFSIVNEKTISFAITDISETSNIYIEAVYDNDLYPYNNLIQKNIYSYLDIKNPMASILLDTSKKNKNKSHNSIINSKDIVNFVNTLYQTPTYNAEESKNIISNSNTLDKVVSLIQDSSKVLYTKEAEINLNDGQIPKLPQTGINEVALSFPSQWLLFFVMFIIGILIYFLSLLLEREDLINKEDLTV